MTLNAILAGLALVGALQAGEPVAAGADGQETVNLPVSPAQPRGVVLIKQGEWARKILDSLDPVSRSGVFGQVGVAVTVTPAGRAENCVVTATSGHAVLDEAVCRAVEKHGRFSPALDASGNPVAATWRTKITTSPD